MTTYRFCVTFHGEIDRVEEITTSAGEVEARRLIINHYMGEGKPVARLRLMTSWPAGERNA